MIVHGYVVSPEVEAAGMERMKDMPQFRLADIEGALWSAMKVDRTTSNVGLCQRVADRLIQRERQAKRIKKADKYPYWVWCGE